MGWNVTVTKRGGIFHAGKSGEIRRTVQALERSVAEKGQEMVRERLDSVLRHPTGRYSRSIAVRSDHRGAEVQGDRVIYGAWLEGTSSRNARSRFKGYSTFRRTKQELSRRVDDIARRDIERLVQQWR